MHDSISDRDASVMSRKLPNMKELASTGTRVMVKCNFLFQPTGNSDGSRGSQILTLKLRLSDISLVTNRRQWPYFVLLQSISSIRQAEICIAVVLEMSNKPSR